MTMDFHNIHVCGCGGEVGVVERWEWSFFFVVNEHDSARDMSCYIINVCICHGALHVRTVNVLSAIQSIVHGCIRLITCTRSR